MSKAVIYARFSSHNQRDESIEQQVAECQAFARANGMTVVGIYADAAISGRSDRRPQFQRMRRDAGKKLFDTIIAYKSSRIARNMLNALNFEVEMTKNEVNVVYAKEEFGNTAAGRFALRTMMSVNQFYSENLGEDIRRTQTDNAQQCKSNGPMPFGYKTDADGHFIIDEPNAKIVLEIYARVAAGETNAAIMQDLNARHIKTRLGHKWTKSSFQGLLGNERYLGIYIFGKTRIPGGMPQIIDEQLFREAMAVAKGRKNKNPIGDFKLTGKLYCGECGEMMVGTSGTGRGGATYFYYTCAGRHAGTACKKSYVGRDQIENVVAETLASKIMSDQIIDQIADEVMEFQRRHKDNPEIKTLEAAKAETKKAIGGMLKAIEMGVVTESTKSRLIELELRNTQITEHLAMLTASQINVTREQVVGYLKSFRGGDINDIKYRVKLFQTFLVKVFVFDDHLKLVFDPLGEGKNEINVTLDEVVGESGECSDESRKAAPYQSHPNPILIFWVPFVTK